VCCLYLGTVITFTVLSLSLSSDNLFEQAHSFIRGIFKACEVKEMPKDKTFLSNPH